MLISDGFCDYDLGDRGDYGAANPAADDRFLLVVTFWLAVNERDLLEELLG